MQGGTVGWAGGAWKFVAIASVLVAGCGGTDGRVPVNGTVTLDGKPAAGLTVWFHASPDTKGNGGYADTDSAGRFDATTHQARPGLYPGRYAITVTPALAGSSLDEGVSPAGPVPGIYTRPETTPLATTIDGRQGPLDLAVTTAK
jgi:hypothetical protein